MSSEKTGNDVTDTDSMDDGQAATSVAVDQSDESELHTEGFEDLDDPSESDSRLLALLHSKPWWLWAALAFLLGSTLILVLPESWLFVQPEEHAGHGDAAEEKEVWACPMLCVKVDHPGDCPVCGMEMEKLEDTGERLQLNERERELIDMRTSEVARRELTHELRSFGRLTFNQRRVERISAWVPGRITRLFADTEFTEVREGDHLFEIYSPELYAAQTEYLSSRRGYGLAEAAREKLLLFGLTEEQLEALQESQEASHTVVISSPASGTIFEIAPREGDYVKEGAQLYTIADYNTLWLLFDAYEMDLPWLAAGQSVDVTLAARPGRIFKGTIEFIEKEVSSETRTTNVRVVLDNQDHELKPGMFANVTVHAQLGKDGQVVKPKMEGRYYCYMHPEVRMDQPGDCPICGMPVELHTDGPGDGEHADSHAPRVLSIPRTAVLDTGKRQIVYVMSLPPQYEKGADGEWEEVASAEFEAREVVLGPRAGKWVAVVDGLEAGEKVVTEGNFLIDSQMELLGKTSLLAPEGSSGGAADPHAGH